MQDTTGVKLQNIKAEQLSCADKKAILSKLEQLEQLEQLARTTRL